MAICEAARHIAKPYTAISSAVATTGSAAFAADGPPPPCCGPAATIRPAAVNCAEGADGV